MYNREKTGIVDFIGIWIIVAINCLILNEIIEVYIVLGIGGVMTLSFIQSLIHALKYRKECKNIMENGIKVQGYIVPSEIHRMADNYTKNYSVVVTYIDPYTGEEKKVSTPQLAFNPIYALGSSSCSVYVLNDEYYVTDFVLREDGQGNIWGEKYDELKKKEQKILLILLTIATLLLIFVCLCCMRIIKI